MRTALETAHKLFPQLVAPDLTQAQLHNYCATRLEVAATSSSPNIVQTPYSKLGEPATGYAPGRLYATKT
jgi:hypothetical protein